MTTIAYRDGIMAADSQMRFDGYGKVMSPPKIVRIGDTLYGGCGDYMAIEQFIKWHSGDRKKPLKMKRKPDIMVVFPGGFEVWEGVDGPVRMEQVPFFAIGSGGDFAIGAMAVGATAEAAVAAAMRHDPHSGGAIQVEKL